jgi:hypothetical protein
MSRVFILILFSLVFCSYTNGQKCSVPYELRKEIESAAVNKNYIESDFYRINELVFDLEFKNELSTLIHCAYYNKNIKALFNSDNPIKRLVAYRLIGVAKDTAFNNKLLERLTSDEPALLKTWSSTALMFNKNTAASDELFKLFSSYPKGLPVDILINIYVKYDSVAVKKTCWKFIDSENKSQQIMSIQCLASFEKNPSLQNRLLEFLDTWDTQSLGWVISSMSMQKMSNLKPLLKKFDGNENLKPIIIEALKNSPTHADNEYALELEK